MPIESRCEGCGKLLRVADEHAGKLARCPECGHVYTVPSAASSTETSPGSGPQGDIAVEQDLAPQTRAVWYMKTPEGQVYGPVTRPQLDDWVSQGRVSHACQLREGEDADWRGAVYYYPVLDTPRSRATATSSGGKPYGQQYGMVQSRSGYATSGRGYLQPHRGGLILTFGILGWLVCPIFSFMAWSMGSEDLGKMRTGRMDPSGMGITQAGQILGMIQSILILITFGLGFLFFICAALADM